MQIVTIEDCAFPEILETFQNAREIGSFTKNGILQIVKASDRYMLITPAGETTKIAIKPAKSQNEADSLAKQFLKREQQRGSDVQLSD